MTDSEAPRKSVPCDNVDLLLAYEAGRRDVLDAIEEAVNSCPSLDSNGYITEKKYVIQIIHRLHR